MSNGSPSEELKTLDWDGALRQVSDDQEFLDEVLQDLIQEAIAGELDMDEHIKGLCGEKNDEARCNHFSEIRKAAHRIKGSAAYLHCNTLIDVSFKLQEIAHTGSATECTRANSLKIEARVETMFGTYKKCVLDIQEEIQRKNLSEKAVDETVAAEVVRPEDREK